MTGVMDSKVAFLARPPCIDGVLDAELQDLPPYPLQIFFKTDEDNPVLAPSYRLAYGTGFFYLYLSWPAERIVCRDRGYQNGDGFILVLATPRPGDAPTDEFYVLGFSAQDRPAGNWAKQIMWYYNVDTTLSTLSQKVQVAWQVQSDQAAFELLLPWSEVYPYHPWFSEAIGFNLAFAEAVGERHVNYYAALDDQELGSEGARRRYLRLRFAEPHLEQGVQLAMRSNRHCRAGETLRARFAALAAAPGVAPLRLLVGPGEGGLLIPERFSLPYTAGLTLYEHDVPTAALLPGGYRVRWRCQDYDAEDETGLTVLPSTDLDSWQDRLHDVKGQISAGSVTTLQFRLAEMAQELAAVKPYETCGLVRLAMDQWLAVVDAAAAGRDLLSAQTGVFRRAFRSAIDGTLQPYSIHVPENYDAAKRYPLLVALHGSGMSDKGFLQVIQAMIPDDFITIAPSGRGISHYYCPAEAQQDIQEAIADAVNNYSIDADRIVLTGFSMGGYGVLRTQYEMPGRYRALAIFSGGMRLSPHTGLSDAPDFLQSETMQCLQGVPLFIFHGRQDHNVPIDDVLVLVDRLRATGTPVEFHIDEGAGHSIPAADVIQSYLQWLGQVSAP